VEEVEAATTMPGAVAPGILMLQVKPMSASTCDHRISNMASYVKPLQHARPHLGPDQACQHHAAYG
jgi:hypothetical protein